MCQSLAVVVEQTGQNVSAYVPDLPGCVATGPSREKLRMEIRDAIAFHLEGLAADVQP
jgi:predicted RNase H-like HicB family nuclease